MLRTDAVIVVSHEGDDYRAEPTSAIPSWHYVEGKGKNIHEAVQNLLNEIVDNEIKHETEHFD